LNPPVYNAHIRYRRGDSNEKTKKIDESKPDLYFFTASDLRFQKIEILLQTSYFGN